MALVRGRTGGCSREGAIYCPCQIQKSTNCRVVPALTLDIIRCFGSSLSTWGVSSTQILLSLSCHTVSPASLLHPLLLSQATTSDRHPIGNSPLPNRDTTLLFAVVILPARSIFYDQTKHSRDRSQISFSSSLERKGSHRRSSAFPLGLLRPAMFTSLNFTRSSRITSHSVWSERWHFNPA